MAKTTVSDKIKKIIASNDVVIGKDRTIKNLRLGKVDKVIVSADCPEKVFNDLSYYAELGNAEAIRSPYPNEELGVICKKPFSISVLSILKQQNSNNR